jgi:hypothetical protein
MDELEFTRDFDPQNVSAWAENAAQGISAIDPDNIFCLTAPADDAERARFAGALLLADWLCYTAPEDRADARRMMGTVAAFPSGFRLYTTRSLPVGYAGWYPVHKTVFEMLAHQPQTLTHRGQITPAGTSEYLYLFNYSVIPQLRGSCTSSLLVKTLATDIAKQKPKGLCAVTVSEDGARIAKKFGMIRRGQMTHDGVPEDVYTT